MEVELFIHGVPKGQDFWGLKEDQDYFSNFYIGNKDDEVRFLVEARKLNNKNYFYYTYLKCKDVIDAGGRAGSYFGISLRFDTYCKDVVNMFRVLDTVYNKYIVNTLLLEAGNKTTFVVASFAEKNSDIQSIQSSVLKLIELSFSGIDFVVIDDSFIHPASGILEFNLLDCTKDNIVAALKKHSKVAISSFYPTKKEAAIQKSCENQLAALANSKRKELEVMNADLSTIKSQISAFEQEIEQLNDEIVRLRTECKEKKEELRKNEIKKTVNQLITPVREPLSNLVQIMNQLVPEAMTNTSTGSESKQKKHSSWNFKSLLPLINVLLLILIIAFHFYTFSYSKQENAQMKELREQVDSLSMLLKLK